jgi:nicotinate-nucleotide pyrophosphorylase (carboxylating)
MTLNNALPHSDIIRQNVEASLSEDIGTGDITALLIDENEQATARVISRDQAVISGRAWVDEVFRQVDPSLVISWAVEDGETVSADSELFRIQGRARSILTAERSALNFLQLLSGIATRCQSYADKVKHTKVKLLDTRKTIPGLRYAQKYAVTCGGCHNHRMGLFDAFLIKENHIAACGSIEAAIQRAREIAPNKPVEVEVENFNELEQAVNAKADTIMLDNFPLDDLRQAVEWVSGRARLEASGGINAQTLVGIAETGVDYISIGTLTKDCQAVDLSMRIID